MYLFLEYSAINYKISKCGNFFKKVTERVKGVLKGHFKIFLTHY